MEPPWKERGMPTEAEKMQRVREEDDERNTTPAVWNTAKTLPSEVKEIIGHHAVSQAKDRVHAKLDSLLARRNRQRHKGDVCRECGHSLLSPVTALQHSTTAALSVHEWYSLNKQGRELRDSLGAGVSRDRRGRPEMGLAQRDHREPTTREVTANDYHTPHPDSDGEVFDTPTWGGRRW